MKYRAIREAKAQGLFVETLFTSDGPFSTPAESHIADIAAALVRSPEEFEAIDADDDPRSGALIELPVQTVELDPDEETLRAALADPTLPEHEKAMIRRLGIR